MAGRAPMIGNVNHIRARKVVAWVSRRLSSAIHMRTVMLSSTATGLMNGLTRARARSFSKIARSASRIITARLAHTAGSILLRIK